MLEETLPGIMDSWWNHALDSNKAKVSVTEIGIIHCKEESRVSRRVLLDIGY